VISRYKKFNTQDDEDFCISSKTLFPNEQEFFQLITLYWTRERKGEDPEDDEEQIIMMKKRRR